MVCCFLFKYLPLETAVSLSPQLKNALLVCGDTVTGDCSEMAKTRKAVHTSWVKATYFWGADKQLLIAPWGFSPRHPLRLPVHSWYPTLQPYYSSITQEPLRWARPQAPPRSPESKSTFSQEPRGSVCTLKCEKHCPGVLRVLLEGQIIYLGISYLL